MQNINDVYFCKQKTVKFFEHFQYAIYCCEQFLSKNYVKVQLQLLLLLLPLLLLLLLLLLLKLSGFIWHQLASAGLIWQHLTSPGLIWVCLAHLASSGLI